MEAWGVADDLVTVSQPADRMSHGYTHTNAHPAPCLSGTRKTGAPEQPRARQPHEPCDATADRPVSRERCLAIGRLDVSS